MMKSKPVIVEEVFDSPVTKVWKAISDINDLKQWYFYFPEFEPEIGFKFQFWGGIGEQQYLHLCQVTEAITDKKLAYSWRYNEYPGSTVVTFELFREGDKTKLKLTHEGLDAFPDDNPDFLEDSFRRGWTDIIKVQLKEFLGKQ